MKLSYENWLNLLNSKLIEFGQKTRVVKYGPDTLELSNGMVLVNAEFDRFKKRVMNKKTDCWVKNIDVLFNGKITEKEIKSKLAAIGGLAVQQKYGDKIKLNLNVGTSWNSGTKGQNIGTRGPRTQEVKDKISVKNSGEGNGMYGVKMSDSSKKKKSDRMKQKILSGEFTPNSNNRNTHWDSTFDSKPYRSSWEALYQFINQDAEYEKLRIEYNINGQTKIYIVDFIDHINRIVVEVKPRELCVGEKYAEKIDALNKWASLYGYTLTVVDKEWLMSIDVDIDYRRFDNNTARKIKALYETN